MLKCYPKRTEVNYESIETSDGLWSTIHPSPAEVKKAVFENRRKRKLVQWGPYLFILSSIFMFQDLKLKKMGI